MNACGFSDFEYLLDCKSFSGRTAGRNLLEQAAWSPVGFPGVTIKKGNPYQVDITAPHNDAYIIPLARIKLIPGEFYRLSGYVKVGLPDDYDDVQINLNITDARGYQVWTVTTENIHGATAGQWIYLEKYFRACDDGREIDIQFNRWAGRAVTGTMAVKDLALYRYIPDEIPVPYLSVNASRSIDERKIYVMVLNRNVHESVYTEIQADGIPEHGRAVIRTLWSRNVEDTNEHGNHNTVRLEEQSIKYTLGKLIVNLPRHSMSAIEIVWE